MSVSPINVSPNLLGIIWIVSLSFFTVAVLLCCFLTFRRIERNKRQSRRVVAAQVLDNYVAQAIKNKMSPAEAVAQLPTYSTSVITEVLLHYFRTLKGEGLEQLQTVICESTLETVLARATREGVIGRRTRALKILSYLPSQSSLPVIFEHLSSENKYIRLTAARGLVRRKALYGMDAIIDSCLEAFPKNTGLLASLLKGFGPEAIPMLEAHVTDSENDNVKAACLEALELLMPARTTLDLMALAQSENEDVRAAALSFSAVTSHAGEGDPIRLCLGDSSVKVKIAAAKIACGSKRPDLVSELYSLTEDPLMWVRYWALKAIWQSGKSGRQFVTVLSDKNPMAKHVILELKSGYV